MAFGNFKKMIGGYECIQDGFLGFFITWKKMNKINKIKKSHDYAWYNEYLKTSKKFKELFIQECDAEYNSIIPVSVFAEGDSDMLELYFSEIFVSHNVTYTINEDEGVYVIHLTKEYLIS